VRERRIGRIGAVVGVAVLGLSSVLAATAAQAAPQDYGNIDESRTGSLTVHKYLHQAGGTVGDPSSAPAAGQFTDPVAGVVFTAYPLLKNGQPVDLTVPANWTGLDTLTPGAACTAPAGYTLGTGIALTATSAQGASTIDLGLGIYEVCETSAPANIVDRAAPFIVTVPLPYQDGWVYDVHAYPKNGAGEITKTITPQEELGLGSLITFPVTVPVPVSAGSWTGFAIRDVLDARLTPDDVPGTAVTVDGVALDPSYYTVTAVGQQVTMAFTPAGLAWLNLGPNTQAGTKVVVDFVGKITTLGNGTITNTAELWPNNPGFDPNVRPPLPSNEVKTHWGSLEVIKRASGTSGNDGLLAGAAFQVYEAADPYALDCSTATRGDGPISVNGRSTFTTGADGVISVPGLFVSDSVNPVIDSPQRCYVLVETAAPAGYVLPADPDTAVTVKIGATTTADNADILNTQPGVPQLPLTGADGQVILITAGVGAAVVVLGLLLMKRRRDSKIAGE